MAVEAGNSGTRGQGGISALVGTKPPDCTEELQTPTSPTSPTSQGPDGIYQRCGGAKVKIRINEAIRVKVKVNVLEISDIDLVREQFTCMFTVHLYYIDPMLADFRTEVGYTTEDGLRVEQNCKLIANWRYSPSGKSTILCESGLEQEIEPTSLKYVLQPDWDSNHRLFTPSYTFGNAIAKTDVMHHVRMLEYSSAAGGHIFEKYKYQATFAEGLELESMPFDRQMLRIRMYGEAPLWEQQLVPFKDSYAGRLDSSDIPCEWVVDENVVVNDVKVPSCRMIAWVRKPDSFRSKFDIVVHVTRVPTFYLWNVVVVNLFITLMTATAFACLDEDFNGRSQIQLLLLLTSVGYKTVTATWVPVKSYLTWLDKYTLVNLGVQAMVLVESWCIILIACERVDDTDGEWSDRIYNGPYPLRSPPERECSPNVATFEAFFTGVLYGGWIVGHCLLFLAHKSRCTNRLFPSWDNVYERNKMGTNMIESFDQHPYDSNDDAAEQKDLGISPLAPT